MCWSLPPRRFPATGKGLSLLDQTAGRIIREERKQCGKPTGNGLGCSGKPGNSWVKFEATWGPGACNEITEVLELQVAVLRKSSIQCVGSSSTEYSIE